MSTPGLANWKPRQHNSTKGELLQELDFLNSTMMMLGFYRARLNQELRVFRSMSRGGRSKANTSATGTERQIANVDHLIQRIEGKIDLVTRELD